MLSASSRLVFAALLSTGFAASAAEPAPVAETFSSLEAAAAKAAQIAKQAKESAASRPKPIGVLAAHALEAGGTVRHDETRLVYSGQYERCYTLTFTRRQGVPGYPESYRTTAITVYVYGQHVETLSNPGESTAVCGTKIHVKGWTPYGQGSMSWHAVERRR